MTPFWSAWIMFLVVLNLGITLFLKEMCRNNTE